MKAIYSENYSDLEISEDFLFKTGKIGCSCHSIEEFVEHAYEQDDYSLADMSLTLYFKDNRPVHVSVDSKGAVRVSADSKLLLSKLIESLENTELASSEINDPISVTYIENQNNSVMIQGNDNIVANADSVVEVTPSPQTPKWKQYIEAIIQNLVANGIWYAITAGIAVIAYLIGKNR